VLYQHEQTILFVRVSQVNPYGMNVGNEVLSPAIKTPEGVVHATIWASSRKEKEAQQQIDFIMLKRNNVAFIKVKTDGYGPGSFALFEK
jgi:hypothetical protein